MQLAAATSIKQQVKGYKPEQVALRVILLTPHKCGLCNRYAPCPFGGAATRSTFQVHKVLALPAGNFEDVEKIALHLKPDAILARIASGKKSQDFLRAFGCCLVGRWQLLCDRPTDLPRERATFALLPNFSLPEHTGTGSMAAHKLPPVRRVQLPMQLLSVRQWLRPSASRPSLQHQATKHRLQPRISCCKVSLGFHDKRRHGAELESAALRSL